MKANGKRKNIENIPSSPRFQTEIALYYWTVETPNSPPDRVRNTNICSKSHNQSQIRVEFPIKIYNHPEKETTENSRKKEEEETKFVLSF